MLKIARFLMISCALAMTMSGLAAASNDDIRILIDVSGSMKKTDPSNLRVSALKLLNGLIPKGSKAGVWTFGRYVDMTVKWGEVDANWRQQADLGAEAIHSNALFTNIESAIGRATKGWDKADPNMRRNLILLTDGRVDISKNADKNAQSRAAILEKSLKKLKSTGVHIQAIALSDDADEVLLKRLALETEGSFEIAKNADDLQKIFFRMFERATQPDTVSINDNQFKVDASIKEMTLLVFRKPGSKSTRIFSPDGKRFSARRPGNSNWRSDEGYDLITIKKPFKGLWSIDADSDPDNRLMVVTDLGLKLVELPKNLLPGQAVNVMAALYNSDKQIQKNSFLRFVDFNIRHIDSDGKKSEKKLQHSKERSQKGQYLYDFTEGFEEGKHSIEVTADSRTFSRSKRVDINVQWPVEVLINPAEIAGSYDFSISAREEFIAPQSLRVAVNVESPGGEQLPLNLKRQEGVWITRVDTGLDGIYLAHVEIEAIDQAGTPVKLDLGKFSMVGVYKAPPAEPVPEKSTVDAKTGENDSVENGSLAESVEPENEADTDWIMTSIIIGVSNLVFILVGTGLFLMFRRKPASAELLLE